MSEEGSQNVKISVNNKDSFQRLLEEHKEEIPGDTYRLLLKEAKNRSVLREDCDEALNNCCFIMAALTVVAVIGAIFFAIINGVYYAQKGMFFF